MEIRYIFCRLITLYSRAVLSFLGVKFVCLFGWLGAVGGEQGRGLYVKPNKDK